MMSNSEEWHIWSIRPGKFKLVEKYIKEKVPEVGGILYPTVTTSKTSKAGEVKKKQSPLYAGYLFLQYTHTEQKPVVWLKLNNHPFVNSYVGPCTPKDLASVNSLQKADSCETSEGYKFSAGEEVEVKNGVFKGYRGVVSKKVAGNIVNVKLTQGNDGICVVFSPEDLTLLRGG